MIDRSMYAEQDEVEECRDCHHGADDAVGKPNIAMRQARHFNGHGKLVEVNQIEDRFPEAWRQQQRQAQDDDNTRSALNKARPEEERRGGVG